MSLPPLPHPEREETAATMSLPLRSHDLTGDRHERSVIHDCHKLREAVAMVTASRSPSISDCNQPGLEEDTDSTSPPPVDTASLSHSNLISWRFIHTFIH